MKAFLIATRNAHKTREIQAVLPDEFLCYTLDDFPAAPGVREDAASFAGNAAKKATELAAWLDAGLRLGTIKLPVQDELYVMADDSGLEVDAIGGAPGVKSARFAALDDGGEENSSDTANNAKLLRMLAEVAAVRRSARFRCVIALTQVRNTATEDRSGESGGCDWTARTRLFDGVCEGRIGFEAQGQGGFGYDPLFIPLGFTQTFSELGDDTKNRISHRALALAKMRAAIID
jgi:XTP/dITP diphosphohydrolase